MIKRFPRLLLCALLCTALALSPLAAAAEQTSGVFAQLAVTLPDGTQQLIPAAAVTTSMGDTVYWVDCMPLTPDQISALPNGTLLFTDEMGAVLYSVPYALDPSDDSIWYMPQAITDPQDPNLFYTLFFTEITAPQSVQEADEALYAYGFETPAPQVEPPVVEEITPVEPPVIEEITPVEPPVIEEITPVEPPVVEEITPVEPPVVEEIAPVEPPVVEEIAPVEPPVVEEITSVEPPVVEEITPVEPPVVEEIAPVEPPVVEEIVPAIEVPQVPFYVMGDNVYGSAVELYDAEGSLIGSVGNGTVLYVYDAFVLDNTLWYAIVNPLDDAIVGHVLADMTIGVSDEDAAAYFDEIANAQQPENEPAEPPVVEEIVPVEPPVVEEITPVEPPVVEEITPVEPPVVKEITPVEPPVVEEITPVEPPVAEEVQLPATPFYTMSDNLYGNYTDLYSFEGNVIGQLDNGTVLYVYEAVPVSGGIWYAVVDPLNENVFGYIDAAMTLDVSEDDALAYINEMLAAEQPTQAPAVELITPEPVVEPIAPEQTQAPASQSFYAVTNNQNSSVNNLRESIGGKVAAEIPNGRLMLISNTVIAEDGKVWYAVTDIESAVSGYMRDYLLTRISDEDAQALLNALSAMQEQTPAPVEAPVEPEKTDAPLVELITPPVEAPADEPEQIPQSETFYAITDNRNSSVNNLRESIGGEVAAEIGNGELMHVSEVVIDGEGKVWYFVTHLRSGVSGCMRDYLLTRISDDDAQTILSAMNTQQPEQTDAPLVELITPPPETATPVPAMDFPAYGMTIDRQATIVLRTAPAADLPTSGAIPTINKPTPLELLAGEYDAEGNLWYLVSSMSSDMSGYLEAYNVEIITQEQAEAALPKDESTPLPPPATEVPVETPTPEPTPTPTPEPTPTLEPTPTPIPEDPQPLSQGDVYHYGRTNKAQVNLREKAKQSSDSLGKLPAGTILWVMTLDGEWCHVRADLGNGTVKTGYMKSEFVTLMGENEEIAYRATLSDPEVAPETPTPAPTATPTPLVELITPEPTEEPTPTPEASATPTPTIEPTATPIPTATPAPLRLDLYARVLNDATPLRGNPDANAYLQTILDAETVVYIFQSQVAADGMTWYLVQYSGQWGFIRADLVRVMGTQETEEYKAALQAALATPTPMPQTTPEPVGPDSTSAYAKLIKDAVNLRRTPSASGTSLGRIPVNTLLLVLGEEYDGTYTWYQVNHNGQDGYVRSDMAQMLTIAQLQEYLAQQAQATPRPTTPGSSANANSSNNVDYVINGSPLQDLIPVPDGWTSNIVDTLPGATPTPDPSATATPVPIQNPAALISSLGSMTVSNVPAATQTGAFSVYGKTKPRAYVKATVDMSAFEQENPVSGQFRIELIASAIAESAILREVGSALADENGYFTMDVKLPQPGEYIVEFAADGQNFARYGVTYDTGATPVPLATPAPLPTAAPIEEEGGFGALPFIIGGLLIVVIAVIYGIHVYNRRSEEAEEEMDEEEDDIDEEDELREQQRALTRQRHSANLSGTSAPRMPHGSAQTPSYMRPKTDSAPRSDVSAQPVDRTNPFARPTDQQPSPEPSIPAAPVMPKAPVAPVMPKAPSAPVMPKAPDAPEVSSVQPNAPQEGQTRRRRRNPTDPNA